MAPSASKAGLDTRMAMLPPHVADIETTGPYMVDLPVIGHRYMPGFLPLPASS
jgi:hypothetical protein